MDVHAAMRDDGALSRIAATLIALAALVEHSASRSYAVRCLVLVILRQAEVVARDFVTDLTGKALPGIDGPETRNGSGDAILLAARFRALAAALGALIFLAHRSARGNTRRSAARFAAQSSWLPVASGDWTRRPNDTS